MPYESHKTARKASSERSVGRVLFFYFFYFFLSFAPLSTAYGAYIFWVRNPGQLYGNAVGIGHSRGEQPEVTGRGEEIDMIGPMGTLTP